MKSFLAHTLLGLSFLSAAAHAESFTTSLQASSASAYDDAIVSVNDQDEFELTLRKDKDILGTHHLTVIARETNNCGVTTTTAEHDGMPYDGVKVTVHLHNNRQNTCPTFAILHPLTMTVTQEYYDRLQEQPVTVTDSFAKPLRVHEGVMRAALEAVNKDRYQGGDIYVDGRNGLVNLTLRQGRKQVTHKLINSENEIDPFCGIVRTTASTILKNGTFLKVTVNYNRHNTCPTFAPLAAMDVIVEQGPRADKILTTDSLKAEDVALIKPAGK